MRAAKKLCPKPKKPVAMKSGGQAAKKVKKVVKGLKKASKLHAKQAKTLSSLKLREGGSTTKKKSKPKKPKGTPSFNIARSFVGKKPISYSRARAYETGGDVDQMKKGGKTKSRVNEAGNYTKPALRKRLFNQIKAGGKGGAPGQWSARKAQMLAQRYKKAGGGYRN